MLKSISNLGKTLSKSEQQTINGGKKPCPEGQKYACMEVSPNYIICHCEAPKSSSFRG